MTGHRPLAVSSKLSSDNPVPVNMAIRDPRVHIGMRIAHIVLELHFYGLRCEVTDSHGCYDM